MNDDNKTIEFPMQPPPPTPQEQLAAEDYSWKCGACNTVVDDTTERKVLPINNIENIVSKNEQDIITARKNKFTSKLKKKRKDNNKRARASRKRNR